LFSFLNGTKQGCVLAPLLFIIFFSMMLLVVFNDFDVGIPIRCRMDGSVFNLRRLQSRTKTQSPKVQDLCVLMTVHFWLTLLRKLSIFSTCSTQQRLDSGSQ
jgi:hypothetical protein